MRIVTEAADFRLDVTDLPPKKRVWGFRAPARHRIRKSASQVAESRRENADTPATNALGRWFYLQPDPIGIQAGENHLYVYAGNNPILSSDPYGLIEWKGTQTGGAFLTAGAFQFSLKSECIKGKCASVKVLAGGPGAAIGPKKLKGTGSGSGVTFVDLTDKPYPEVFNGEFLYVSAGIAVGKWGVGATAIQLGGAKSVGAGRLSGLDASIGFLVGSSTVIESRIEDCCPR